MQLILNKIKSLTEAISEKHGDGVMLLHDSEPPIHK